MGDRIQDTKSRTIISEKGFLGPSIAQSRQLPSCGIRAARKRGVGVDDGLTLRCPPGTPRAGEPTDMQLSNCYEPKPQRQRKSLIEDGSDPVVLFSAPVNGDHNLLDFKAGLFLEVEAGGLEDVPEISQEEKVGLFTTRGRLGRAVQSVGSFIIPGDTSTIRSPGRSAVYQAATPGGGSGPRARGPRLRCPAGYQFGGRFADSSFSNCGAQLFQAIIPRSPKGKLPTGARRRQLEAQVVPRVGSLNRKKQDAEAERVATIIEGLDKPEPALIRRDGLVMRMKASSSRLNELRNAPEDLDDAYIVKKVSSAADLNGTDDIELLYRTPARSLRYVLPNKKGTIELTRKGDLTSTDKRRLGRAYRSIQGGKNDANPGSRLQEFAEKSNGKISYNERIESKKDSELVTIEPVGGGAPRTARRWVFELFFAKGAPLQVGDKTWKIAKNGKKSASYPELRGARISTVSRQESIDYKATAFLTDVQYATGAYEVKRLRAVFDAGIGRFRCPEGTVNGGRITNRLGTGCGRAVARRIFGAVADLADGDPNVVRSRTGRRTRAVATNLDRSGGGRQRVGRLERLQQRLQSIEERNNAIAEGRAATVDRARRVARRNGSARRAPRTDVPDTENTGIIGRARRRVAERLDAVQDRLDRIEEQAARDAGDPIPRRSPRRRNEVQLDDDVPDFMRARAQRLKENLDRRHHSIKWHDEFDSDGVIRPKYKEPTEEIPDANAAIEHLRNGGDIGDIPNEFLWDAVYENSWNDEIEIRETLSRPGRTVPAHGDNKTALFKLKIPESGAIGDTTIFERWNPETGQKEQGGLVFKASKLPGDNFGEAFGHEFAHEIGVDIMPARFDGRNPQDSRYVVLEHFGNTLPDGSKIDKNYKRMTQGDDDRGIEPHYLSQEDQAYPQRLANFFANAALGVEDRHSGNGLAAVDPDGKVHALPIDLAWAGWVSGYGPEDYQVQFYQDAFVLNDFLYWLERGKESAEVRLETRRKVVDQLLHIRSVADKIERNRREYLRGWFERHPPDVLQDITVANTQSSPSRILHQINAFADDIDALVEKMERLLPDPEDA